MTLGAYIRVPLLIIWILLNLGALYPNVESSLVRSLHTLSPPVLLLLLIEVVALTFTIVGILLEILILKRLCIVTVAIDALSLLLLLMLLLVCFLYWVLVVHNWVSKVVRALGRRCILLFMWSRVVLSVIGSWIATAHNVFENLKTINVVLSNDV